MHDGSITFSTALDNAQLEKDLARLNKKIEKKERDIADLSAKLDVAREKSLFDVKELDAEKAKLAEMRKELEEIKRVSTDKTLAPSVRDEAKAGIPDMRAAIAEQRQRVNMLQAEWNKTEKSVERYAEQLAEAESTLNREKEEAGELVQQITEAEKAQSGMAGAINRADEALGKFSSRIGKLASRVFVFTLITTALRSMRTWLGKAIKTNEQASASIAKLKGALLTLAQPIVQVIIPAFISLVNITTKVVSAIASVVSFIFGTTAEKSAAAAESLYDEQKALGGVGSAAKKAGKQLANFDEINKLSSEDSGGGGSGSGGIGETEPDFSFIKDGLEQIAFLVGSALLAVGAILTFSGINVPLGIALMAAGALTLATAITMDWGAIAKMLQGPIGAVMAVLSTAFLVIGAILAFSSVNIPLGIAMMAIGAAGMAAVITANWGAIVGLLQGPIGAIVAVVSAALLVIGAILVFSSANIPLGLGLMAAGAIGLAASVAANWGTIQSLLAGPLGVVVALVSGALLAIGMILLFSGASAPLGLGLVVVGAIGLAASIAANWDSVQSALQGSIGVVTALVSGALLVLGAILTFSGVTWPLGLGLLVVGAVGLVTSLAANWDAVQNALQGPIGTVVALVSAALLALGAVILFSGALFPLGLGLIVVGAIGLATSIAANWDTVQNALGGPISAVTALVSGALLVLGVILLFSGAGIPLGLGLIAVGAGGLVAVITPNWNFIKEAIMGAYDNMIQWWDSTASQFFTLEYWAGLAADMLNGLFGGLSNIGSKIASWGSSFINGVKNFFGIHSPSTEFEGLGYYMMAGLENGVDGNTEAVVAAFSVLFTAVTALCTNSTETMQLSVAAFLTYFLTEFVVSWEKGWYSCYKSTNANITLVMADIDRLNAKLASIPRVINIKINISGGEALGSLGGLGDSGGASAFSARLAAMPAIAQDDIPHLARGAVIPPNREFMAVLGDQKRGTNIETPLPLMVQAFKQALAESKASMGGGTHTAILEVDRRELGRVVYQVNNEETQRIGVSFAGVNGF